MTTIGQDVYSCWRRALEGKILPASDMLPTGLGGVDGHPQCGLYAKREGGGYKDGIAQETRMVPVKIYLADDTGTVVHKWADGLTVKALVGKDQDADAQKIWSWCQTRDKTGKLVTVNAITKDSYAHWLAHERWPDDAPTPAPTGNGAAQPEPESDEGASSSRADSASAGIGHNSGEDPDSVEALMRVLGFHDTATTDWLKTNPEGTAAGDKAANWKNDLLKLENRIKGLYAAEKAPILAAERALDEKWRPIKVLAETLKKRVAGAIASIGEKERVRRQAIADAEARKRADEARAKHETEMKAHAEAQAKAKAERDRLTAETAAKGSPPPEVELPPPPPPPAVVAAEKVHVAFGGSTGRKVAVKAVKHAVIEDWRAAAAHYAFSSRVQEVVQKLADADAKNGIPCPGAQIGERSAAA